MRRLKIQKKKNIQLIIIEIGCELNIVLVRLVQWQCWFSMESPLKLKSLLLNSLWRTYIFVSIESTRQIRDEIK